MSQTFSLVCHETKQRIWVGQGWGRMETFYSGDKKVMSALTRFLQDHENKELVLVCNDKNAYVFDYKEYRK